MRTTRIAVVALVTAGALMPALSACGSAGVSAPATPSAGSSPAAGQLLAASGLSVTEVLAYRGDKPLAVRAYLLLEDGGSARLCDALAESFPPQCGGDSIAVTGLPPELVEGLRADSGVRWSEQPVQLIGNVRGDVFVNDPLALAAS
jgi:hypothetical protein